MKKSLVGIANNIIPFPQAAAMVGISAAGRNKVHCPFGLEHPDGGRAQALRVYPDHGYCFAEQLYFTVSSFLAAVWEVDKEDAAAKALRLYGWKPATYAHLWEQVSEDPEPDKESLARALIVWCERTCPDWKRRQYNAQTADRLARCLGLLSLVQTEQDCQRWLEACRKAMRSYLC